MSHQKDGNQHGGGPKTPEGKRRSALNATRHGLLAKTVVLPTENLEEFQMLLDDYIHDFSPQTRFELDLVQELAATRWRIQRTWGMETTILQIGMKRSEQALQAEFAGETGNNLVNSLAWMELTNSDRSLQLLHRYESRLVKRFHQIQTELRAIAKERAANNKNATIAPVKPAQKALPNELLKPVLIPGRDGKTPSQSDKLPPEEDTAA